MLVSQIVESSGLERMVFMVHAIGGGATTVLSHLFRVSRRRNLFLEECTSYEHVLLARLNDEIFRILGKLNAFILFSYAPDSHAYHHPIIVS
jgi:hypothetical protein